MSAKLSPRLAALCALLAAPAAATAQPGTFGSVEWLLLSPKVNSTGFQQVFYDGVDHDNVETDGSFDNSLESGVRFVVGHEMCDGFGGQVRYFSYDNDIDYAGLWDSGSGTIAVIGQNSIDVDALDVEVTQRGSFRTWDLVATGGLRYGSVDITQPQNFFNGIGAVLFGGPTGVDFDGVGPTFSMSARRPLGYGLSLFGRARTALLFGHVDVTSAFNSSGSFRVEDEFAQVWEFQFGLNCQHDINGHAVTGGIFWEAQRWDSDSGYLGDLALHGLGMSAGVTY